MTTAVDRWVPSVQGILKSAVAAFAVATGVFVRDPVRRGASSADGSR